MLVPVPYTAATSLARLSGLLLTGALALSGLPSWLRHEFSSYSDDRRRCRPGTKLWSRPGGCLARSWENAVIELGLSDSKHTATAQCALTSRVDPQNMKRTTHRASVPLVVLDDPAALDYARSLFDCDIPLGVVSSRYSVILPFMVGNNGLTVALVADVDDPDQLAGAIGIVERRLGRVTSVIRYAGDVPVEVGASETSRAS